MNKLYIIIVILTLILVGFFCYNKFAFLNIVVKFDDLEPFEKQMKVYYKGFNIGKTTKIYPDKQYKNTYILLKLHPADINLPENITARIQTSKANRYINILYPDAPSLTKIKSNDVIQGKLAKDINSLINDDGFSEIVSDASTLMESANVTVRNLGELFNQISELIADSRKDILKSISNIADTTSNLENVSANLNSSLSKQRINNSAANIEQTTKNIKGITTDLNNITMQVNKVTVPLVNSTICQTYSTVRNTNEITGGIKNTLKKNMGLGRLLFGKPINETCEKIYAYNNVN